ncbi:MAG: hypothetical protein AAFX94_20350, partial [Myxococcota bacterium]
RRPADDEMQNHCYAGHLPPTLLFRLDDAADVISGPEIGKAGAVISLEKLEPEPVYVLELRDGTDRLLEQSIRLAAG